MATDASWWPFLQNVLSGITIAMVTQGIGMLRRLADKWEAFDRRLTAIEYRLSRQGETRGFWPPRPPEAPGWPARGDRETGKG